MQDDKSKIEVINLGLEKLKSEDIRLIAMEIKEDENKLKIIERCSQKCGQDEIVEMVRSLENKNKFLTEEMVKKYEFKGKHVAKIVEVFDDKFSLIIDEMLEEGRYDGDKVIRLAEIIGNLKASNSGKLSKIAVEIGMDVFELPLEEQENVIKRVKEIYLTKNLPEVAKDFLIFEQMHPVFLGEAKSSGYNDRSRGDIPSLNEMNPSQRRRAIFSDLLRCAMESNSRDLREYISIIENGDKYFTDVKEGRLKIDKDLPEEKEEILRRYAEILNALYNQTSKGKRADKQRENKDDLEQDLIELETLFNEDSKVHIPLPDRVVRTFGYWAGIRTFDQSKQMLQDITKSANERNIA